jgi:hypothetical protein
MKLASFALLCFTPSLLLPQKFELPYDHQRVRFGRYRLQASTMTTDSEPLDWLSDSVDGQDLLRSVMGPVLYGTLASCVLCGMILVLGVLQSLSFVPYSR